MAHGLSPGDSDVERGQGEKEGPAKEIEKEQPVRWKETQENVMS